MPIHLRSARPEEARSLSALCMRSKAHWGYDAAFMAACRDVLTIVRTEDVTVAEVNGTLAGMARISFAAEIAELDKLFVDPPFIGQGVGRALFVHCSEEARRMGANRMMIDSDPDAAAFYKAMGAVEVGTVASEAIPGRMLPLLEYRIR